MQHVVSLLGAGVGEGAWPVPICIQHVQKKKMTVSGHSVLAQEIRSSHA